MIILVILINSFFSALASCSVIPLRVNKELYYRAVYFQDSVKYHDEEVPVHYVAILDAKSYNMIFFLI